VLGLLALPLVPARAEPPDNGFAPECAAPVGLVLTVGAVDCVRFPSAMLGNTSAFSYYVPPACAPAHGRTCPVLYYLHGTGGSYREGLGPRGAASGEWIRPLTSGPPVDPRTQAEPWRYADMGTWVPKPAIDMIVVAPHGRTLPGGYGPRPDQDPFWFDWNPRYAKGGDMQRYDTPAPRFASYVVDEIIPFVDANFPTDGTRQQRALVGTSMGGIGALTLGLKYPDKWASIGARSGGGLPSVMLAGEDAGVPLQVQPPAPVPHTPLPGVLGTVAPEPVWEQLYGSVVTVGFGDMAVADSAFFRDVQPFDLAPNARAYRDKVQALHIKYFVNDAIPRRVEDFTVENPIQIAFEVLLSPTNRVLETTFDRFGVERTFHMGPGTHSGSYSRAYHREQLEAQYANLRHWDGTGSPRPNPEVFDYRTSRSQFEIWNWKFSVAREPVEFLNLTDVSCNGLTLRGTGVVTVSVPETCETGVDGKRTFDVDLGPTQPVSEPQAAGSSQAYGRTVTVDLSRVHGDG
jgi:S-formylglutathione hydrolase FrmB